MDKITVKLPNGLEISGSPDVVMSSLAKHGYDPGSVIPEGYYLSASKGLIPIKSMNSRHIINAIVVLYKAWLDKLNKLKAGEFREAVMTGPTDPQLRALLKELVARPGDE